MVSALTLLVKNIRNPLCLAPTLRELGARHKSYRVIEKHCPAVNAALMQAFEQNLKADWT
ncbi:MAG: globin domain-containing protein [Phormidesmis sp.]